MIKIKCFASNVSRLPAAADVPETPESAVRPSSVSALQDELTGALIGLARACRDVPVTGRTSRIILEGLFTTVTNVSFDDDAIIRQIEKTHAAKEELVPGCGSCGAPCGKTEDYDMQQLWNDNEDIRSLKSLILFGLRGMAAYAYHAQMLGYQDDEVNDFFCEGLFKLVMKIQWKNCSQPY